MKQVFLFSMVLLFLGGCFGLDFGNGLDDDGEGVFPRIESFEPIGSEPVLLDGEVLTFSAEASDEDSFDLDWVWEVGDSVWQDGSTSDGFFSDSFDLSYDEAVAVGWDPLGVRFAVTDPEGHEAQHFWRVSLELGQ